MEYTYRTAGTCSQEISFQINNGIINCVKFHKGCDGNLKAIGLLVDGMSAEQIAARLGGNLCEKTKNTTSCADQLARAVLEAQAAEQAQAIAKAS